MVIGIFHAVSLSLRRWIGRGSRSPDAFPLTWAAGYVASPPYLI